MLYKLVQCSLLQTGALYSVQLCISLLCAVVAGQSILFQGSTLNRCVLLHYCRVPSGLWLLSTCYQFNSLNCTAHTHAKYFYNTRILRLCFLIRL